jgi:uncharacterized protein YqgV (UPF0045/DUF77 family)
MRITVELSLYPLQGAPLEKILAFIETIRKDERLEVVVNQMSTQLRGELDDVVHALRAALERSFENGGSQALVAKFLNADLPIGEPPVLDAPKRGHSAFRSPRPREAPRSGKKRNVPFSRRPASRRPRST